MLARTTVHWQAARGLLRYLAADQNLRMQQTASLQQCQGSNGSLDVWTRVAALSLLPFAV